MTNSDSLIHQEEPVNLVEVDHVESEMSTPENTPGDFGVEVETVENLDVDLEAIREEHSRELSGILAEGHEMIENIEQDSVLCASSEIQGLAGEMAELVFETTLVQQTFWQRIDEIFGLSKAGRERKKEKEFSVPDSKYVIQILESQIKKFKKTIDGLVVKRKKFLVKTTGNYFGARESIQIDEPLYENFKNTLAEYRRAKKQDLEKWSHVKDELMEACKTIFSALLRKKNIDQAIELWKLVPDDTEILKSIFPFIHHIEMEFRKNNTFEDFVQKNQYFGITYEERDRAYEQYITDYMQRELKDTPDLWALYSMRTSNSRSLSLEIRRDAFSHVVKIPERQAVTAQFNRDVLTEHKNEDFSSEKELLFKSYLHHNPGKIFADVVFFYEEIQNLSTTERALLIKSLVNSLDLSFVGDFLSTISVSLEEYTLLESKCKSKISERTFAQFLQEQFPLSVIGNSKLFADQEINFEEIRSTEFSFQPSSETSSAYNIISELNKRSKNIIQIIQHQEQYGLTHDVLQDYISQWVQKIDQSKDWNLNQYTLIDILILSRENHLLSEDQFSEGVKSLLLFSKKETTSYLLDSVSPVITEDIRTLTYDRIIDVTRHYSHLIALLVECSEKKYVFTETQINTLIDKITENSHSGAGADIFEKYFIQKRVLTIENASLLLKIVSKNYYFVLKSYKEQGKLTSEELDILLQKFVEMIPQNSLSDLYYQDSNHEMFTAENTSFIAYTRLAEIQNDIFVTNYFSGNIQFSDEESSQIQKSLAKSARSHSVLFDILFIKASPEQCESFVDDLIQFKNQKVLFDLLSKSTNGKINQKTMEKITEYLVQNASGETLESIVNKIIIDPCRKINHLEQSFFSLEQSQRLLDRTLKNDSASAICSLLEASQRSYETPDGRTLLDESQIQIGIDSFLECADVNQLLSFIKIRSHDTQILIAKSRAVNILLELGKEGSCISNILKSFVQGNLSISQEQKLRVIDILLQNSSSDDWRWLIKNRFQLELSEEYVYKAIKNIVEEPHPYKIIEWYKENFSLLDESQFNSLLQNIFSYGHQNNFLEVCNSIKALGSFQQNFSPEQYRKFFEQLHHYDSKMLKTLQDICGIENFDVYLEEYLQSSNEPTNARLRRIFHSGLVLTPLFRQYLSKEVDDIIRSGSSSSFHFLKEINNQFVQERIESFDISLLADEKKFLFFDLAAEARLISRSQYGEYFEALEKAPVDIYTKQLSISCFFGNIIHNKQYEWFDTLSAEIPSEGEDAEKESASEFFKNFVEDYKIGNKGKTIVTLLAAREYAEGVSVKNLLENIAQSLFEYRKVIDRYRPEKVPKGLRASIGLEYEITGKIADGYAETHLGHDLKKDILKLSAAGDIGKGNDAVHEIAGKPSDNPYLVLLEMKLIQDLGFINFNFDQPGYAQGGHGYHLTIGGETGVHHNRNTNFLQNALIMSGWGGVNAGADVSQLGKGRGDIRERGSGGSVPVFRKDTTASVELRCFSVDKCEPFERTVFMSHNAAIAIQAVEKYLKPADVTACVFAEQFPNSVDDFLEELALKDAINLDNIDESVMQIIFEWIKLMHETRQAIEDHNQNFWDNETSGYLDEEGEWVDTVEFGGQNNKTRFDQVVKGIGSEYSAEEYAFRLQISPECLFSIADRAWVNKLTAVTNLFLKPSKEFAGDQTNVLAMLETTKLKNGRVEDKKETYLKSSVFDTKGDRRQGYYNLQGGSKKLITHRVQQLLLNFNSRMEQILSEAEVSDHTEEVPLQQAS